MNYAFHKRSCNEPGVNFVYQIVCGAAHSLFGGLNEFFNDGYVLYLCVDV